MGFFARGSIYTTILELAPQNHDEDGLLGLIPYWQKKNIYINMDPLVFSKPPLKRISLGSEDKQLPEDLRMWGFGMGVGIF